MNECVCVLFYMYLFPGRSDCALYLSKIHNNLPSVYVCAYICASLASSLGILLALLHTVDTFSIIQTI